MRYGRVSAEPLWQVPKWSVDGDERPMTGLLATLSPAQQEAAVNYRGEDVPHIGSWMQTYSGKAVYPMDLRPEDICIEDIAHSLSMQCRYNGHGLRFYSVAEHSVLIARHLRPKHGDACALHGLLHDATEAYLADVPRPVKPFLQGYKAAELGAWEAIAYAYDVEQSWSHEVHDADARILHDERIQNMSRSERDWGLAGVRLGVTLEFWEPQRAKAEFLGLFEELYGEE